MKSLIIALVAGLLTVGAPASAQQQQTYTGTIGGAEYRVEVPSNWNGSLLLYSHGYYPTDFAPYPIGTMLANRQFDTPEWLLEHGYALAASEFKGRYGYMVEHALRDQIALLDWFTANVGKPRRTISTGTSMGGAMAALLAERNPDRFAGVLAMCSEFDPQGTWNMALDVNFAVKTLLGEGKDIDLVRAKDPVASTQALQQAVEKARQDDKGRARIALAAAVGNIPGWYSPHAPEPTKPADRIDQQALWIYWAYIAGMGPGAGRVDLERRAGGNPSFNIGIDYRQQLARSSQRDAVKEAYETAKLDLDADLAALAKAPRVAPDPQAVHYMYRNGVVSGKSPVPVVTLHGTRDGGAVSDQEAWYAKQVDRPDRLRQLFVNRGGHCGFSASEELTSLRTLLHKIDTGHWPDTSPAGLNTAAAGFGAKYQNVFNLDDFTDKEMPPAFTRFTPANFQRPSR
jgi:pimeloyl-ACP methyl ester carboxylesterase